ncbi:MAG: hypothetical protein JRN15_21995, partial [Nitrososphaerota archaeon]|nr:hypothetical protein [Nitrososphaerota archaeon]
MNEFIRGYDDIVFADHVSVVGANVKNCNQNIAGVAVVGVESAKAMWLWQKGELTGEQAASECFKVCRN